VSATQRDPSAPSRRFATTQWSLVLRARDGGGREGEEALADLCRRYWYPLYAYVRRRGHSPDQAQDLTQEFFCRLLERDFLSGVSQDKGRFRSFLLASCEHFLSNQREAMAALKRGRGREKLLLDVQDAEGRYLLEPGHNLTPERLFERRWALTLLEESVAQLRSECERAGKGPLFTALRPFLTGDGQPESYRRTAASLGMSEGALKVAVHRLRRRYRERLRAEIARTLGDPSAVEDEIRHLFSVLGS
jgi:RNA polymerase sigma factor (sigma-70 family)